MGILSWKFRIVLFLGSVVVFLLIARFVRKQRIQVKDGIFWILFSVILIIFSIKNSELIQDIAIYRTLEGEEKRANGEENS